MLGVDIRRTLHCVGQRDYCLPIDNNSSMLATLARPSTVATMAKPTSNPLTRRIAGAGRAVAATPAGAAGRGVPTAAGAGRAVVAGAAAVAGRGGGGGGSRHAGAGAAAGV